MSDSIERAFKQFTLETQRLETVYQALSDQFSLIKQDLQESNTRLSGKISELDFVTHYLGAILDHISQGILFIDSAGNITTFNPAAEQILGFKRNEVLHRPFCDHIKDNAFGFSLQKALKDHSCPKLSMARWEQSHEKYLEIEIESNFVLSEPHTSLATTYPGHSTSIQGLLLIIRNVTELKSLQEKANRQDRLKELGEVVARLAHEIRNPLGSIKGFAKLLQDDLKDQPETKKLADFIVEGSDNLNAIVSNILNYSRAVHPHYEQVDIVLMLQELLKQIQSDQKFHDDIHSQLKTTLKSYVIPIDGSLMRSALLNLIVNAVEAMPKGGYLTLSVKSEKGFAKIGVKDTGVGIPKANIDKLFSPFFTTKKEGNGLGLSEVFKIVQAHEGTIDVFSEDGKGTEFVLKIPIEGEYGH